MEMVEKKVKVVGLGKEVEMVGLGHYKNLKQSITLTSARCCSWREDSRSFGTVDLRQKNKTTKRETTNTKRARVGCLAVPKPFS